MRLGCCRGLLIPIALVAFWGIAGPARAAAGLLGVAIHIERSGSEFGFSGRKHDVWVSEYGLGLTQWVSPQAMLYLEAGYADAGIANDPAGTGLSPSGYYGRLGTRYRLPIMAHLEMSFRAAVGYHRLADTRADRGETLRWWSYAVAWGPRLSFGPIAIEVGAVYRGADGDQAATGGNPATRDLRYASRVNPYADLVFTLSPGGSVAIHAEGGARRSLGLVFGYRFESP